MTASKALTARGTARGSKSEARRNLQEWVAHIEWLWQQYKAARNAEQRKNGGIAFSVAAGVPLSKMIEDVDRTLCRTVDEAGKRFERIKLKFLVDSAYAEELKVEPRDVQGDGDPAIVGRFRVTYLNSELRKRRH